MPTEFLHLFETTRQLDLNPGQTLFLTGTPVEKVFLVRSGQVALVRRTAKGGTLRLQQAGAGEVLAEASVWSLRYHCDAEATQATKLATVPVNLFRRQLASDVGLADAWARHLARAVQTARFQAGLLALRCVAERLDAWLDAGNSLPPLGQIQTLAADLGVSREALYRELSRRRNMVNRS